SAADRERAAAREHGGTRAVGVARSSLHCFYLRGNGRRGWPARGARGSGAPASRLPDCGIDGCQLCSARVLDQGHELHHRGVARLPATLAGHRGRRERRAGPGGRTAGGGGERARQSRRHASRLAFDRPRDRAADGGAGLPSGQGAWRR
ncbi:unnamed protein product, partial [Ectocarpus sp. 12 AP-2014]